MRAGPHTLKPELRRVLETRQRLVISERRPSLTLSLYCTSTHTHSLGHTCRVSKCVSGKATIWVKPHLSMTVFPNLSPYNQLSSSWALHQCWLKFKASFFLSIQSFRSHSQLFVLSPNRLACFNSLSWTLSLTHFKSTKLTYLFSHTLISLGYVLRISPSTSRRFYLSNPIFLHVVQAPCIYFFLAVVGLARFFP